ncbi:hypothetical protein BD309DRAFT_993111 [Dichomitus squalens]|nr:hypothetical protein BD309DRAFT_993111 [Dichomitus squalens]
MPRGQKIKKTAAKAKGGGAGNQKTANSPSTVPTPHTGTNLSTDDHYLDVPGEMLNGVPNNSIAHSTQLSEAVAEEQLAEPRYGLRARTSQNQHPAKAVGVSKRSREEIATEVNAKKAKKQAADNAKAAEVERQQQLHAAQIAKIAALEDNRAQQDRKLSDTFVADPAAGALPRTQDKLKSAHRVREQNNPIDGLQNDGHGGPTDMVVEESEVVPAPRKQTLTAAEKRAVLRESVLLSVSSQRASLDVALSTPTRLSAGTSKSAPLSGRTRTPASESIGFDDESGLGGFEDGDVYVNREAAIQGSAAGARAAAKQLGIKVSAGLLGESDADEPSVTPNPKRTKGVKKDKSFSALPDYIKPVVQSKIIPSIIEYYGTREDVWNPDATHRDQFLDLLQDIQSRIFPCKNQEIKRSDTVYKYCRQRFYEWHNKVQSIANNAVRDAMVERRDNDSLTQRDRSENGLIKWLEGQLASGAAYYGQPKTTNAPAKDLFQSKYILKTFAYHLVKISGSVLPDAAYPAGALALSCAAVQRAFEYYIHDKPYGVEQKDFSAKENAHDLTAEWYQGNVSWALAKDSRFENIMAAAMQHMREVPVAKRTIGANPNRLGAAPKLFEPPSSP